MLSHTLLARTPLAVIVIAQLFGTSLWFSVNGVGLALQDAVGLSESDLGLLTIAVQAGFITGTLLIATTGLADRIGRPQAKNYPSKAPQQLQMGLLGILA